jgi:hypothetical protein
MATASSLRHPWVDPHELFNRKMQDFIEDLEPLLRHLPEYQLLAKSTQLLWAMNARQNQHLFHEWVVVPFDTQIRARDEEFFLRVEVSSSVPSSGVGVVSMLRNEWRGLSANDKAAVWSHLQVLVVLSARCKQPLEPSLEPPGLL